MKNQNKYDNKDEDKNKIDKINRNKYENKINNENKNKIKIDIKT